MVVNEHCSKGATLFAVFCIVCTLVRVQLQCNGTKIPVFFASRHPNVNGNIDELIRVLNLDPVEDVPRDIRISQPITLHIALHTSATDQEESHIQRLIAAIFHHLSPLGDFLRLHVDVHRLPPSSWRSYSEKGLLAVSLFEPSGALYSDVRAAVHPPTIATHQCVSTLLYFDNGSPSLRFILQDMQHSDVTIHNTSVILTSTYSTQAAASLTYIHLLHRLGISSESSLQTVLLSRCVYECHTLLLQLRTLAQSHHALYPLIESIEQRLYNLHQTSDASTLLKSLYNISDQLHSIYSDPSLLPDFSAPPDVQAAILFPYWFPILGPLLLAAVKFLRREKWSEWRTQ